MRQFTRTMQKWLKLKRQQDANRQDDTGHKQESHSRGKPPRNKYRGKWEKCMLESMKRGEMYMKYIYHDETGVFPAIADTETRLLERNVAATPGAGSQPEAG